MPQIGQGRANCVGAVLPVVQQRLVDKAYYAESRSYQGDLTVVHHGPRRHGTRLFAKRGIEKHEVAGDEVLHEEPWQ